MSDTLTSSEEQNIIEESAESATKERRDHRYPTVKRSRSAGVRKALVALIDQPVVIPTRNLQAMSAFVRDLRKLIVRTVIPSRPNVVPMHVGSMVSKVPTSLNDGRHLTHP